MTQLPPDVERVIASLGGRYAPSRLLGQGGFGAVVAAYDRELQRDVALKLMLHVDRVAAARQVREGKLLARVIHPGIVRVFDCVLVDGVPMLVLELVDGRPLDEELRHGALAPARAIEIALALLDALGAAHSAGIVHRDLKPQNVILTASGPKLLDFGIARPIELDGRASAAITASGVITGTPAYMAPEQARGETIDHRADVYAMGILLHELLTGAVPFAAGEPLQVLLAHIHEPVPDPAIVRPELPRALCAVVRKALAKLPAERFADAALFAGALKAVLPSATATATATATAAAAPVRKHAARTQAMVGRSPQGAGTRAVAAPRRAPALALAVAGLAGLLAFGLWDRPVAPRSPAREAPAPATPSPAPSSADLPPLLSETPPIQIGVIRVGRDFPTFVKGWRWSMVQARTDSRVRFYLWSAPAQPRSTVGDLATVPRGAWKRQDASRVPCVHHRLKALWPTDETATRRFLKVTLVDDPAAPAVLGQVDRRATHEASPSGALLASSPDDEFLARVQSQNERADPPIDLRVKLATGSRQVRRQVRKLLAARQDGDAIAQLVAHAEALIQTPEDGGRNHELAECFVAATFADAASMRGLWKLVKRPGGYVSTPIALTFSGPASADDDFVGALEADYATTPHRRGLILETLILSRRGDRLRRVARLLDSDRERADRLFDLLAVRDEAITELALWYAERDPACHERLLQPAALRMFHLQRRGAVAEWLRQRDFERLDEERQKVLIATLGDSNLPGKSISSVNRLAGKPHPLRAHALLALARAGQKLPPVADLAPGTVAALALAMDGLGDHAEQLETWARNLQLTPGARGAAAFGLALRKPSKWPEISSRLRNASKPGDRFSAALDQVDAWVRSGHVPPAVDFTGRDSGKASRALMVVPATPGWSTAVGGLWLELKPAVLRVGRWGWWKDGPAKLECFSSVDTRTSCRVEDRFTPIYLGGYSGEIAVRPESGTPLPPEDEGLEWMVLEKTLDRDDGS